jgi:hypothetical protein
LENNLDPEEMTLLDQLISTLDTGEPPDDDAVTDYVQAAQQRQGVGAGMGSQQQEGDMNTHAMDEMRNLRSRLRAAGVPIGNQPAVGALRHLAQHHPAMRGGMAMDSARDRSLSFGRMFPKIAARFAKAGPGSFCVLPGREAERTARMALDERRAASADPRLSIRAVFGAELANRLKV